MDNHYKFTIQEAQGIRDELRNQSSDYDSFEFGYLEDDGFYYICENLKDKYLQLGFDLDLAVSNYLTSQSLAIETFLEFIGYRKITPYRILDLVSEHFVSYPIENIDFTIHLKRDIALSKDDQVFKVDGRPDYFIYYYNDQKIAKRVIEITADPLSNLMSHRKVMIAYYRQDDSLGEYFIVGDQPYNMLKHETIIMEERVTGRKRIIAIVKGLIVKVLSVHHGANKTFNENLHQATEFFSVHDKNINIFIETGVVKKNDPAQNDYLKEAITSDVVNVLLDYITYGIADADNINLTLREAINGIIDY